MTLDISIITSRLDNETLIRVFDRDRDKQIVGNDVVFMQACLDTAENTARLYLSKAFSTIESYDAAILSAIVSIALYEAVRYSTFTTGSPNAVFRQGYEDAMKLFRSLVRDEVRPQVMSSGSASNQHDGAVENDTNESGESTSLFVDIQKGKAYSAY